MEKQKQFLTICAVCHAIRIDNKNSLWLQKDDDVDFKLYDLYMGNPGRVILSHGYCPRDFDEEMKKQDIILE